MAEKAIDSTLKILQKMRAEMAEIRSEIGALRSEVAEFRAEISEEIESLSEYMAGAVAQSTEARGIAIRLRERIKRLEDRK
jgi:peptidoglycan hydrolase CwlO-like protein